MKRIRMKTHNLLLMIFCIILINSSIASAITITPRISKDNYQIFMFSILGITDMTLSITTDKIAFTNLHLQVSEEFANISLKFEKLDGPPGGLGAPAGAYQHIKVINSKIRDAAVDFLIIEFRVKKEWLSEKGIKDSAVVLKRYTYSDGWIVLPTTKIGESIEYAYYSAKSPGFGYLGYFSIAVNETIRPIMMKTDVAEIMPKIANYSPGSTNETVVIAANKENKTIIQNILEMIRIIFRLK